MPRFTPAGKAAEDAERVPVESADPSASAGARDASYADFYRALGALREEFHRIGRFDDANAKLDELCKLLVLKVLDGRHPLPSGESRLSANSIADFARSAFGDHRRTAAALHRVFDDFAGEFPGEFAAFGPHGRLNMQTDDDPFADALLPLLASLPAADDDGDRWQFDGLNEAFGHFIQDGFRHRKEDAQYMTPPEVVSAVVDVAFCDLANDPPAGSGRILVADPTCGVGSFLAAAHRRASRIETPFGPLSGRLGLFGQDKVDRMVRMANVNLKVFARADAEIRLGNSIVPAESLDDLTGRVDLVVTNPPFGARFAAGELLSPANSGRLPVLADLARDGGLPKSIDSEYVLLDRELALLKPGGRLLMVVPDHVVSAGGFSERFRRALLQRADLVAVVDLPAETFAQAGTRTKTSVVFLRQRVRDADPRRSRRVFLATSEDLGFRVVARAGASVKRITGAGDVDQIVDAFRAFRSGETDDRRDAAGLSRNPSAAAIPVDRLIHHKWTAGFYKAERLLALEQLDELRGRGFRLFALNELAAINPQRRERVTPSDRDRCISVLHVRDDGCIDLRGVDGYRPATACVRCLAGDVLLSRINPRIPRICVVPETDWGLGCSAEFAVLRPSLPGLSPWSLMLLLRSEPVQAQIQSLTSGTSSSHNRVKDRDLQAVLVPVPEAGSDAGERLSATALRYEAAAGELYRSLATIHACLAESAAPVGVESRDRCDC